MRQVGSSYSNSGVNFKDLLRLKTTKKLRISFIYPHLVVVKVLHKPPSKSKQTMSQTGVLLREIKAPRAVLKFECTLPWPMMLHDGLYRMHRSLFNGFLLADADFHAIGQFLTQELSQLSDKMASVLCLMPCCIASYALLVMTGSRW